MSSSSRASKRHLVMGTRLYCEFSDSILEALLDCDAHRLSELKALEKTADQLERRTRTGDELGFELYKLIQEIPQLAALQSLRLFGFGKFDLDLLPDQDRITGSLLVGQELTHQVVDSCTYARAHPDLYATLVLAGCREIWWT